MDYARRMDYEMLGNANEMLFKNTTATEILCSCCTFTLAVDQ